ncbi:MAG: helix-turn-helix domain-containing protein [Phycisphaerae bacterium]|nr:helix-turn-helix domain-containing protein [Phycisphaerae bacterium]
MNKKANQSSEKLLSTEVVAQILSLSKRTIHRLNSSGLIIKPLRISGSIRYRESELMAWIKAEMPNRRAWEAIKNAGRN